MKTVGAALVENWYCRPLLYRDGSPIFKAICIHPAFIAIYLVNVLCAAFPDVACSPRIEMQFATRISWYRSPLRTQAPIPRSSRCSGGRTRNLRRVRVQSC